MGNEPDGAGGHDVYAFRSALHVETRWISRLSLRWWRVWQKRWRHATHARWRRQRPLRAYQLKQGDQDMKKIIISVMSLVLMVSMAGCGLIKSATDEYNELIALVQNVQAAASNFQLVTDTQYAKIQAKTQITADYYEAVAASGEVWTGNFRDEQ